MELEALQDRVLDTIEAERAGLEEVFGFVLAHPELGHAEFECASYLTARLAAAGLRTEAGIAGLSTAFRGTITGGSPGRRVGIAMLYDAVPSIAEDGSLQAVHSCGHPSVSAGVWAAVNALARVRDQLNGSVTVVGCPADEIHAPGTREIGGGKLLTAARGIWDGFDAALYVHPEFINTVSQRSLWMRRDHLYVPGVRSLSGHGEESFRALSGLMQARHSLDPSRFMIESLRLDGDVEEGSGLALDADLLFFGADQQNLGRVAENVRAQVRGRWAEGPTIEGVRPDDTLTDVVATSFSALHYDFVSDPPPLPFATDFGNISRRTPAALVGVGRPGGWGFHTERGVSEFASDAAVNCALDIARVLALTVLRLCGDDPRPRG